MKMSIAMIMGLSSGLKVIKNAGLKKQKQKKNSYLLLAPIKMVGLVCSWRWKKWNRKIVGINMGHFVSADWTQKCLADLKFINKHDQLESNNPWLS